MLVSDSPPSSTASSASTSPSFARRHPPQSQHSRSQHHHGSRHRYYSSSHSSRQQCRASSANPSTSDEAASFPDSVGSVDPIATESHNAEVSQSGFTAPSPRPLCTDPGPSQQDDNGRNEENSEGNLNKEDAKDNAN